MGLVPPGTIEKSTLKVSHAALFDEKSGGDAFCCATAAAASAAHAKPAKTPAASNFAVEANVDIAFLLRVVRSTQEPVLVDERYLRHRYRGCRVALRACRFILRRFGTFVTRCGGMSVWG